MVFAVLVTASLIVTTSQAGKPDKGGGGKGGGNIRLCVMIDEPLIANDPGMYSDGLGIYCDGVDRVKAIAGGGFRLDTATNSSDSNPPIRYVALDFSNEVFPESGDPGTHDPPAWPDTSNRGLAPTDIRFHIEYYCDANGNLTDQNLTPVAVSGRVQASARMDPITMSPGEVARAALTAPFRTYESDGTIRQWKIVYGDAPGSAPFAPEAVPVWVTAGPTDPDTSRIEQWTIEGSVAALYELVPGRKKNSTVHTFVGYFYLPTHMTLQRL